MFAYWGRIRFDAETQGLHRSSSERLRIARSIKQGLRRDAEAAVWDEGVFSAGNSTLDDLLRAVDTYDFGVFVFAPDDLSTIRKEVRPTVRDNVIFELGLFMGRLGKARAIWVVPTGQAAPHIPADLQGIKHLQFDVQMENREAAAGFVCDDVRTIIDDEGVRADNRIEEIEQPKILCASSRQWAEFGFEKDVEILTKKFNGVVVSDQFTFEKLNDLLTQQSWDILHLVGFVHVETGDFCFSDIVLKTKDLGVSPSKVAARGLVRLVELAKARLVVLATCESLALAAQLARVTNVIAAAASISAEQIAVWGDLFYGLLAKGKPLSQAFDIAKEASDSPLVLVTRKDFRVAADGTR